MAEFEYKAVGKDEYKTVYLRAGAEIEAQTVLSEQGLTVVSLRQRSPLEIGVFSTWAARVDRSLNERMSVSEKILFTSQMASMIRAGLPIMDARSTFIDQKGNSGTARIVNKMILEIGQGVKFSEALAHFDRVFSQSYLAVVRSGEGSGTLADSLAYLASQLRRESDLSNKVMSALIYPIVVITAMIAVMAFISVSVIPKILLFAQSTGQKLPGYTLTIVNIVSFMTNYWYVVAVVVIVAIFLFGLFAASRVGSRFLGRLSLRLPIIGA